jgi:hypothetical protein
MKTVDLPLHELAFLAATRGLAGAGVGLLASQKLNDSQRKTAGWILLTIGVLSTIPLGISVYNKLR